MIFVIDDLLMNFFLDKKFLFVFGHVSSSFRFLWILFCFRM